MKTLYRNLMLATALTAGLAIAIPATSALAAEDGATVQTNPGFKPGTGQINPGETLAAPSSSIDIRKIPSHAEAVAALMAPNDPNPVPGQAPAQSSNSGSAAAGGDKTTAPGTADPTTATQGQAAIGGPLSPGASAGGSNGATAAASNDSTTQPGAVETTGKQAADQRPGPIGATGQTMPAKFSERNDTLDRLPTMAWPLRLSNEDRKRVYQAVMADKSQPASDADALSPASELSTDQALNQTYAMPDSLKNIDALKKLTFLKAKNKVLLIEPATRTVVDEITS